MRLCLLDGKHLLSLASKLSELGVKSQTNPRSGLCMFRAVKKGLKKKNSLEMKEMNLWRREMAYLEALFEELFSTFH